MKIKLKELVNAEPALDELAKEKVKAVLSYKIASVTKKVKDILVPYHKVRIEKIEECGDPIKDKEGKELGGFQLNLSDQKIMKKFMDDMEEVVKEEVDIEIPEIKMSEFPADVLLAPENITALLWLIKD